MSATLADGDQQSERHPEWIAALGRATYEAARVAGISFDLLRVFGGVDSEELYNDPLGTLLNRLRGMHKKKPWPELATWLVRLDDARQIRNDLIHALPVRDGLHRRNAKDPYYTRDFFTAESLDSAARMFRDVANEGTSLLYSDGGRAVRRWYGVDDADRSAASQ